MISSEPITVVDSGGVQAAGERTPMDGGARIVVRLNNGGTLVVPPDLLQRQNDGTYRLPVSFDDLARAQNDPQSSQDLEATQVMAVGTDVPSSGGGAAVDRREETVIPVIEETVSVTKQAVETGGVRIRKIVREHEEVFQEPLLRERVDVERVPIGRLIDGPAQVRQEGDTMIIPLVEEVVTIQKRLLLKEEVRITRRQEVSNEPQTIPVRSEDVVIERFGREGETPPDSAHTA